MEAHTQMNNVTAFTAGPTRERTIDPSLKTWELSETDPFVSIALPITIFYVPTEDGKGSFDEKDPYYQVPFAMDDRGIDQCEMPCGWIFNGSSPNAGEHPNFHGNLKTEVPLSFIWGNQADPKNYRVWVSLVIYKSTEEEVREFLAKQGFSVITNPYKDHGPSYFEEYCMEGCHFLAIPPHGMKEFTFPAVIEKILETDPEVK